MPTPPKPPLQMVIDTSVILDFHLGGLLPKLFALPYRFLAPDAIVAELQDPANDHMIERA